jgi:hypothetical protein
MLIKDLILDRDSPAEDSAGTVEQSARTGATSSDRDGSPICGEEMTMNFREFKVDET